MLLRALGAVIFISLSGFIVIHEGNYIEHKLGITPQVYGIVSMVLIWIVMTVSTRKIFHNLTTKTHVEKLSSDIGLQNRQDVLTETMHKYPPRLRYLLVIAALFFLSLPYLGTGPGKTTAPATYIVCFAASCLFFLIAFHVSTYSVVIKPPKIVIRTFIYRKREIDMSDIAKASVVRTKNGPNAVISLRSGERFRFGGMLTNFSGLLDNLRVNISSNYNPD